MKRAGYFFRRMDILRNYCRVFLVLALIGMFFSRMFSVAFFLLAAVALFSAFGALLRVPDSSGIAEFVSDSHAEFENQFRRTHSTVAEEDWFTLYAYSIRRARLARNIGNKMYFPEYYTLIFRKMPDGMELHSRLNDLYHGKKPECAEQSFGNGELRICVSRMEGDSEYGLARIEGKDGTALECYIRNDHTFENFRRFCGKSVIFTEEDLKRGKKK